MAGDTDVKGGSVAGNDGAGDVLNDALARSEARYRRIVETANEGIWTIDAASRTDFVNARMAQMLGYSAEEMLGRSLDDFMDEEMRAVSRRNVQRREQGISEHHEFRFRRKDGRDLHVTMATSPILDDNGAYAGALALVTDITDRARIEARETARAQALLLIATDAPLPEILDAIVRGVQAQHHDMLCSILLVEETGGGPCLRVGAGPALPAFYNEAIDGLLIGPDVGSCGTAAFTGERVIVADINTSPLWTDFRELANRAGLRSCWSEPVRDGNGSVVGTFAIYHRQPREPEPADIETISAAAHIAAIAIDRASSKRALLELNMNLELLVGRRTAELELAKEQAEAASRAKSEFVSNMSHEIRTPMHSIIGLAYLVRQTRLDDRQADYMEKIDFSARHLLRLVDDILDFSKIEAGKLDIEVMDLQLADVFTNVAAQMEDSASRNGLALVFEADPRLAGSLRGDPVRIGQVLLNYVSNAVKFSENGEIRVSATLVDTLDSGVVVRFEVTDSGIGMSEEEISRLFRLFHQADGSTTRRYGGTGLGLAISKRLVELMGGEVGVHSRPGAGSTFWFTLPLQVPVQQARIAESVATDRDVLRGARVLLVEDNPVNQLVGKGLLEFVGIEVEIAGNGQEALDLLAAGSYDAVLMDLQMPVMDGFEATRRLRADAAAAQIPVIAMTANAGSAERARCSAVGMDDFITKPIRLQMLYDVLGTRLRARGRR